MRLVSVKVPKARREAENIPATTIVLGGVGLAENSTRGYPQGSSV